jgi:hypothetical protein
MSHICLAPEHESSGMSLFIYIELAEPTFLYYYMLVLSHVQDIQLWCQKEIQSRIWYSMVAQIIQEFFSAKWTFWFIHIQETIRHQLIKILKHYQMIQMYKKISDVPKRSYHLLKVTGEWYTYSSNRECPITNFWKNCHGEGLG